MRKEITYEQALHRAAALCTRSEKCELDIHTKLTLWGLSKDQSTKIISHLKKEKFLDNQRYASFFVRDKSRFNKWGKIKISFALRAKKIDEEIIREALNEIDEKENLKVLIELLAAKEKNISYQNDYDKKGKLIRFALSRGYELKDINKALKI